MSSVVATWAFSKPGVLAAASLLSQGGTSLDAVERGIQAVELDPTVTSAGYGGLPNARGHLQLDAALMTSDARIGAVMSLHGFRAAIPIARRVLEHSAHPVLAAGGAASFAAEYGFRTVGSPDQLLSDHAKARYAQFCNREISKGPHVEQGTMPHTDTIGMIACDRAGSLVAGCATSGMQFKAPGRVGDSPLVGAGLYADRAGAAVATGDGDKMIRFCIAFLVVERLRDGRSVQDACQIAMQRVHDADPSCQAGVTAMTPTGEVGAAATHAAFRVVQWRDPMNADEICCEEARAVSESKWKHSCV